MALARSNNSRQSLLSALVNSAELGEAGTCMSRHRREGCMEGTVSSEAGLFHSLSPQPPQPPAPRSPAPCPHPPALPCTWFLQNVPDILQINFLFLLNLLVKMHFENPACMHSVHLRCQVFLPSPSLPLPSSLPLQKELPCAALMPRQVSNSKDHPASASGVLSLKTDTPTSP